MAGGQLGETIGTIGGSIAGGMIDPVCFAAGTPLLTPDGAKPIEQIKVGDWVLSAPEDDPSVPVTARRVEEVFQRTGRVIELRVGGRSISTTHEHPFYVEGKGWKQACVLEPGDLLKSHDGQLIAVESLRDTQQDVTLYNMRIEEYHTYFVVDAAWGFSVWAHNANGNPLTGGQQAIQGTQLGVDQAREQLATLQESYQRATEAGNAILAEGLATEIGRLENYIDIGETFIDLLLPGF